jgi:hypothetical protein
VPHVGVQGLTAGDDEHHRAEDEEPVQPVPLEELDAMAREDGPQHVGPLQDLPQSEAGEREKPDKHDGTEEPAHPASALLLNREQADQDQARDRHHARLERRARHREPLDGAQYGDGRRDHAVPVEQGRTDDGEERHPRHAADAPRPAAVALRHEREQREDAPSPS